MNSRPIHIAACFFGLLALVAGALARQESTVGFSSGGQIGLRISSVGVGDRARPGDWAAIQVDVQHRFADPKPVEVIVSLQVPNDDGDIGLHQRKVTTNPGRHVTTWLYARLPFTFDSSTDFSVSAYIPYDQEAGADTLGAYDPTKPVGTTSVRASSRIISPYSGLIGIVGRRPGGVERYAERVGTTSETPLTGHELTEIAPQITPASIPDRVHGLRAFEALIWTGGGADEQPGKLSVPQADAIREWVASGGHLVVVMPLVGQTWLGTPNPLSEILPRASVVRNEGVDLAPLRYLLVTSRDTPVPTESIVHTFTPDVGAGPFDAMPIITAPDGKVLVIRRQVGIGAVTMVGLDVANLATLNSLRADAFWNRVLGKRLELPTSREVDQLATSGRFALGHSRKEEWFERSIPSRINRESQAAVGLLVAVVLFSGFWLVAGPVGFFVLKQRNKIQHAWVAYVGAIGLFTAISWGAATVLRQRRADARHVTVLDHVYGQPCQRARVWANLFLPEYGTATISVPEKPFELAGRPLGPHPAIAAWESPRGVAGSSEFPETRTYIVDARDPKSIAFPARSTSRQVQIDWTGAPLWSMPLPQAADAGAATQMGEELSLLIADPRGIANRWTVTGSLTHNLPQPLKYVVIIVNRGQTTVARPIGYGNLTADAGVFQLNDPWEPGKPLDLSIATQHGGDQAFRAENYLDRLCPKSSANYGLAAPDDTVDLRRAKEQIVNNLLQLSLYSMLAPPAPRNQGDSRCVARRESMHTLDLGRWFTQPCVIVIGMVEGDCPVPIQVDGRDMPASTPREPAGITAVRWVYPLRPAPPPVATVETGVPDSDSEGTDADGGR